MIMAYEKLDAVRIGNIIKSIHLEKNIPVKEIARKLNVSVSTISQFETGKNYASIERCKELFSICDCQFDYDMDFNEVRNKLHLFYEGYAQVNQTNLLIKVKSYLKNENDFYSFARFEYALILYLYSIISEKLDVVSKYNLEEIIQCGLSSFDSKSKSIYMDLKSTYYFWGNNINESRKYALKALELNPRNFMANYHYGIINIRNGYYTIASQYLDAATIQALNLVAFERLIYITLCKSLLLQHTYQFEESLHMSLNLLNESRKRKDIRLEKSVKSNIVFNYLIQKKYEQALKWLNDIDEQYLEQREMIYKVFVLYQLRRYDSCMVFIKKYYQQLKDLKKCREFLNGLKYLIHHKSDKAIQCFETCYRISVSNGELDNAMFDLRVLEELYYEFGCLKRTQRVYELLNEFYRISHSKVELDNVKLSLE